MTVITEQEDIITGVTPAMDPEVKAQWIEALESGKYAQTKGSLQIRNSTNTKYPEGFCCLGVLCDLAAQAGVVQEFPEKEAEYDTIHYGPDKESAAGGVLPTAVRSWAGLRQTSPVVQVEVPISRKELDGPVEERHVSLVELNDEFGFDFRMIANVVREHL